MIQHVLIDNSGNYEKTPRLRSERGKRVSGRGLLTSFGEEHLNLRRSLQPAFAGRTMGTFWDVVAQRTQRRMAGWREGAGVDLAAEMEQLALGIILGATFGLDFDDGRLAGAVTAQRRYIEYLQETLLPWAEHWPVDAVRKYRRARVEIDGVIGEYLSRSDLGESFVGRFGGLSLAGVRDEVLTLLSTGYETMGEALCWTLYLLGQHEEIAARARAEIASVVSDGVFCVEQLPRLTYLRQVFDESMRLYPPTWIYVRMAREEDCLPGGVKIARGTKLYLSQYVTQRSAKYFPDPLRFDPERFSAGEISRRPRFAYFPFGGGVHRCMGEQFAVMEGLSVLAMVLPRFRFEADAGQRIELLPTVTLRAKNGVRGWWRGVPVGGFGLDRQASLSR